MNDLNDFHANRPSLIEQDLVEGTIYIMSSLRKIIMGATYYYVATVNGNCRLKMSTDVSAKMEEVARENGLTEFQMLNLNMKMVAVRTFNGMLRHYEKKLILIAINRYGGYDNSKRFACNGDDPGKEGGGGSSGMASGARGVHFNV